MNRIACVGRLVDLLTGSQSGAFLSSQPGGVVGVAPAYPGQFAKAEQIVVSVGQGEVSVAPFAGVPITVDDEFDIEVAVLAALPGQSAVEAGQRCEQIVSAVLLEVQADAALDDFEDVIAAVPSAIDGPKVNADDKGHWASATVTIRVHSRYGGS